MMKTSKKNNQNNSQLPLDMLDTISQLLDMDDLFSFGGVCQDWRLSYTILWREFMASAAPLVIRMKKPFNRSISFYNISDGKSYKTVLPERRGLCYASLICIGFSSGYLIMANKVTSTLLFVNRFLRRMIQIRKLPEPNCPLLNTLDHAVLAFATESNEYVIATVLEPYLTLYVYQSRNSNWENYSRRGGYYYHILDVVVLHHTIYCIDCGGRIGVLNLNNHSLKFLKLNNTPRLKFVRAKLLSSDGQLLVVHFKSYQIELDVKIFKIDFSTMEWVKVETLGDQALFLCTSSNAYVLNNPGKWGYDNNCLYYIDGKAICKVYSMKNELIRIISSDKDEGEPLFYRTRSMSWCFQNLRDEVDYSLGE